MTAVRVHVDHSRRKKYDRWQNPKGSARVYAWAYSSGHCRISHQVSLWIAYCSLTANCVTLLKRDDTGVQWSDDEFEHLTNVSVWFSHYWLGWVWAPHSRGLGSSLGQRERVVWAKASVSRAQHFAVVGCLHACFQSLAHTPLPFCLLQLSAPTKTHYNIPTGTCSVRIQYFKSLQLNNVSWYYKTKQSICIIIDFFFFLRPSEHDPRF